MPKRLDEYAAKRDLKQSPEPRAEIRESGEDLMFTVQKHNASHLHYDFRLEHGGVLLSWAIPKGPSYDPGVKRLAVRVEDHPVAYGKFEGVIPEGNYGAGEVLVWDFGQWIPQGEVDQMLHEGVLKFQLNGQRMQGLWALIQMHRSKNWLLIKEHDGHAILADEDGLVRRYTDSALHGSEPSQIRPESFHPQLATFSTTTPQGDNWIHEVKFDGYRIVSWRTENSTRLFSRNGLDWTSRFSDIAKSLADILPPGVTVDGEVVVFDEDGRSNFGLLQRWLKEGLGGSPVYVAFDLLIHHGVSIMDRPLIERKRMLQSLLREPIRFSEHIESGGDRLFASACELGLEGIVSKRRDAQYEQSRTRTWLKRKCVRQEEFIVGGFTKGKGTRGDLGAILVGQASESGSLEYCGKVGSGFDDADLERLAKKLKSLSTNANPFSTEPEGIAGDVHWVRPKVVVEIKYAERTQSGLIRQGVFLGEREDTSASEVQPEMIEKSTTKSESKITHPERVLFGTGGITKAELAAYYDSVATLILPFIAGRPLAVLRCPDGIDGECFFQKHVGAGMPSSLGRFVQETQENIIVVNNRDDLMSLVQFGTIELHPWGSSEETIEQPDIMTFDLDPGPDVAWGTVVQATLALRERLAALELPAYVKTSGGKGFHVVAPIQRGDLTWEKFKAFAKAVAEDMDRLVPGVFVTHMAKSKRQGRIFLDYLRNGRGATSVAAFSVRARANAPVSMPIAWDQVTKLAAANTFTVGNVSDWLPRHDPVAWKGYFDHAGRVTEQTWKRLMVEPNE